MTPPGRTLRGSIGSALRAERERRRTSIDAVARGTLVRQDFLELIDDDRLEELPSGAYAKGFIRSYAAFLGLDPKPFLDAYDERCGRPAPELSPLVRRGIRVPPAAQRRAWQVAISSAAALIILLVVVGAFRSGDDPADLPEIARAPTRQAAAVIPTSSEAVVRIEVIADETWIDVEADGQQVFGQVLQRGDHQTFKAAESIAIYVSRAQAVLITANGQLLGTPQEDTYRAVFTPQTTSMPPHQPTGVVEEEAVEETEPPGDGLPPGIG